MKYLNTKSSKNASKSRMQIKLPRFNWHGLKMIVVVFALKI